MPKSRLTQALASALADEKQATEFFSAFLDGEVYALEYPGPVAGEKRLAEFADQAGGRFIPLFSEPDLVPSPSEGMKLVTAKGRELLLLARGRAPVVLNAGQRQFKRFGIEDVERILDRLSPPPAESEPAPTPLQITKFTKDDWDLIGR